MGNGGLFVINDGEQPTAVGGSGVLFGKNADDGPYGDCVVDAYGVYGVDDGVYGYADEDGVYGYGVDVGVQGYADEDGVYGYGVDDGINVEGVYIDCVGENGDAVGVYGLDDIYNGDGVVDTQPGCTGCNGMTDD